MSVNEITTLTVSALAFQLIFHFVHGTGVINFF